MLRILERRITITIAVMAIPLSGAAQGIDGTEVLDGLGIPAADVATLEQGGILAYSDEEYESTRRELAADALVLVDTDLGAVERALGDAVTVIPTKVMLEHAEINDVTDFADVTYTAEEIDEVEKLFDAKRGKDFNFSDAEYALIESRLGKHRRSSNAEKIAAASEVMREILQDRYAKYRAEGLGGIPEYSRSRRKQVDVGHELSLTTDTFRPFEPDFPEFFHVMMNYPSGAECCHHHFRWLKVKMRKRPTFALAHTMIQKTDSYILYTERFYYVNNSLNSVQVTLSWLPYDEDTYMGLAMSASADVLDSMLGRMLRPLGRNKAIDLVTEVMTEVRAELEE